ncbi:MAG: hypothetical protein LUI05_04215 [Oscillospiraceae bacterium]|nr:hypothetical protein [Oscillospiraceae bacterium]
MKRKKKKFNDGPENIDAVLMDLQKMLADSGIGMQILNTPEERKAAAEKSSADSNGEKPADK